METHCLSHLYLSRPSLLSDSLLVQEMQEFLRVAALSQDPPAQATLFQNTTQLWLDRPAWPSHYQPLHGQQLFALRIKYAHHLSDSFGLSLPAQVHARLLIQLSHNLPPSDYQVSALFLKQAIQLRSKDKFFNWDLLNNSAIVKLQELKSILS